MLKRSFLLGFFTTAKMKLSHFKLAMHFCQISSRTNEQQQIDGLGVLFAVYEYFSPCSNYLVVRS